VSEDAPAPTITSWVPVSVSLTYALGEFTLFSWEFSGRANRQHFTTATAYSQLPDPPVDDDPTTDFFFYPVYPIAFTPEPLVSRGGWLLYTPYTFTNYYVDVERVGTFGAYLNGFSSKSRSTLQRKVKKFTAAGGGHLTWSSFTRVEDVDRFLALAGAVSATTYQERLLDVGLPRSSQFAARAKALAASGEMLAYILFLNDDAVAYMFCSCADGIATYSYVGYDPKVRELSAGTVLQYLVLKSLFDEPRIRIFDFGEGEGAQKKFFATDGQMCAKTYVFRRTPDRVARVHLHYRLNRFVAATGHVLDSWGIKGRVRKFVRQIG